MVLNGEGGANTRSGLLFEKSTRYKVSGTDVSKTELGKYYEEYTGEFYALSTITKEKLKKRKDPRIIPKDKNEKAKVFKGEFLLFKALEPDEAYLDRELSTLTIVEKKSQNREGSVDEKLQTVVFKMQQYQKIAKKLDIENVHFVYILSNNFNDVSYTDTFNFIRSVPNCDYYFEDDIRVEKLDN